MPWRIPSARCPRCGEQMHRDELRPVPPAWLACDENDDTDWPGETGAVPCERGVCPACYAELHGLYDDATRWERELRAYLGGQP